MVLDLQKLPKNEYKQLQVDWYYYRKIVLNNNRIFTLNLSWVTMINFEKYENFGCLVVMSNRERRLARCF